MLRWFRRWRRRAERVEDDQRYQAFRSEVVRGGWRCWVDDLPGVPIVETLRLEWEQPGILRVDAAPPWMNVAGLYWRDVSPMLDVTPRAWRYAIAPASPSRLLH